MKQKNVHKSDVKERNIITLITKEILNKYNLKHCVCTTLLQHIIVT
jgi:hypothetical protein